MPESQRLAPPQVKNNDRKGVCTSDARVSLEQSEGGNEGRQSHNGSAGLDREGTVTLARLGTGSTDNGRGAARRGGGAGDLGIGRSDNGGGSEETIIREKEASVSKLYNRHNGRNKHTRCWKRQRQKKRGFLPWKRRQRG